MDRNIKSQATLEYIFIFSLSVMFLIIVFFVFSDNVSNLNSESRYKELRDIAHSLRIEITTAESVQNGYNRSIIIPEKIMGKYYFIEIVNNEFIYLKQDNVEYMIKIPKTIGSPLPGENIILKQNNEIIIQN